MSTITLDTLTLPAELIWVDEYGFSKIKSNQQYTLQGKMIINEAAIVKGRPVTLVSENAWMQRSDLDILFSWAQEINKTMVLTMHDGGVFDVGFRHWEQPVIEAENITGTPFQTSTNEYIISLKLVTI